MVLDAELLSHLAATPVQKSAITALNVLNEAYDYKSSFSRGLRLDLNGLRILLISGTASIDEKGNTVHPGDFRAQLRRTYYNITGLLESEARPGKTLSRRPAICVISIATMGYSTKGARSSSKSRVSIHILLR